MKTPIPAYTRAVADACVYDETFYPTTIVEALSIARMCMSYYSFGVMEAAALGVSNLCVAFRDEDHVGRAAIPPTYGRFFTREEGSAFQFDGVSRTTTPTEAIAALFTLTLEDFSVDAEAQREYVRKFIDDGEGRSLERLLDAIASRMWHLTPAAGH